MKNICIVSFCNMYLLPYAKTYINSILENGCKCTLLFWDRDCSDDKKDLLDERCNLLKYPKKLGSKSSAIDKVKGYIGATNFIRKCLKKEKFDGVIFLQTHAAVACNGIIKKKYNGKCIVDIRDFSLENKKWFKKAEEKAISNSYKTIISSPAYKKFLPEGDYVVAHNYSPFDSEKISSVRKNCSNLNDFKISISFIGTVRFYDMDKKILSLFANDERFKINYYGFGSEILSDYCEENSIKNVEFKGAFAQSETTDLYSSTNIINNLYGNHSPFLDYALSNKLYHSAQFHIPILVCPETYMEEVVKKYNMGYTIDVNDSKSVDNLYNWYTAIDRNKLAIGCDEFLKSVKKDNEKFYKTFDSFVNFIKEN